MHHLCGLCSAFIERCTFRYAELYQARPEGVDLSDPSHLADDFVHHANYPALCASALQGCHICVFLRILIERGHPYELGRYTAAARETSLPIKLSQESHGEWRYDETRGDCIHIRVPCGPTKIAAADRSPRAITAQLHYACLKPSLLPDSDRTFDMISRWLDYCRKNHARCMGDSITTLPTRVLDVKHEGSDPFLFVTDGEMGQYLALSHCWGKPRFLTTTTANIDKHKICVSMSDMPQNFQDAVIVARRLGFRYLWIDSLCIIQDSESDWLNESVKMGSIYANSSLTIAASSAAKSGDGFLLHKNPLEITPYECVVALPSAECGLAHPWHINSPAPITYEDGGFEKGVRSVPLHHRAWVLQERVVSPRTIHYVQDQVLWECTSHAATEFDYIQAETLRSPSLGFAPYLDGGHYGQRNTHITSEKFLSQSPSYRDWYDILMDYTSRSLTHSKDRMPAIWALAQEMQTRTNGTYIGGLWLVELTYGLLFRRTISSSRTTTPAVDAPSWSWASLETPVVWTDFTSSFSATADILAVDTVPMRHDAGTPQLAAMGRTQSTALTLSAYVDTILTVSPSAIENPFPAVFPPQRLILDSPWSDAGEPVGFAWLDYELEDLGKPLEVTCVQLGHRPPKGLQALGILVAPTGSGDEEVVEYRRVGYYERFFEPSTRLMDRVERRKIRLV